MGEKQPTLAEIEKILSENQDKAVEGFYITGHMLDEKVDKRGSDLDYAISIIDLFKESRARIEIQTSYSVTRESDGYHHKLTLKATGAGSNALHDIAINYFVMDQEKNTAEDTAEKEKLEELIEKEDPFVFPNKEAKHGILDARIVNKYEIASNLGAMFGYAVSFGNKDYAQIMGVRFALLAEKLFGKKE